ncbi:hypothetical protein MJ877_35395, partial [Mesorhizobium jarvisii]|nr:hypothetical protein [Mesorhizobium jarvisii]
MRKVVLSASLVGLGRRADRSAPLRVAALRRSSREIVEAARPGTVRNSVCGRAVEHYAAIALMKRSPKMTANWALAMVHSRGGI